VTAHLAQRGAAGCRVRVDIAQASDPGRDPNKQVNEDSSGYVECQFGHLLVLCDGMGGHHGGREASLTAIQTIFDVMQQAAPTTLPAAALKLAVEEAGRRVYAIGGPPENRMRPGSTVVTVLIHDRGADVAHVGDSRAYCIRSGAIYPLTRDHSMVQGMIDIGALTEEQAIGHPDLNKITRALGMKPDVVVDVRPEPMEVFAGDLFLLCSDGLTDVALGRDILAATQQALVAGTLESTCHALIRMANDRGGPDNVTVQLARVVEVASKATIPEPGPMSQRAYAPAAAEHPLAGGTLAMGAPGHGVSQPAHQSHQSHQSQGVGAAHGPHSPAPPPTALPPVRPGAPTSDAPGAVASLRHPPAAQGGVGAPVAQQGGFGVPGAPPHALSYDPHTAPGGLDAYRANAPHQLPLPPRSQRPTPVDYPPTYPVSGAIAVRSPVGLIILGLCAVIAILVVVVLWQASVGNGAGTKAPASAASASSSAKATVPTGSANASP
jgi:serine/threonine protein phosphatase PrpC